MNINSSGRKCTFSGLDVLTMRLWVLLGEKSCVALLEEGDRLKARVVLGGMSSKLSIPSLQLRP